MTQHVIKQQEEIPLMEKPTKTALAKRLGISRSMLYYRHNRPVVDEEIKRQIESVWVNHPAYGHKRLAPELKLNKKRILRVMKRFKMKPYRRRAKQPRKKNDEGKAAVENEVNVYKLLCPIWPYIVWVSDFTYIKYQGRFIYLATIMDMYTREIVGVAISRFHDKSLVLEAFMDAETHTGKHPFYLHSDQGSEYTSQEYKIYVKSKHIMLSFSEKGSPWQNGFQESFYGKFKVDLGEVNRFETIGELIEAIHHTMYYYNNDRRHTSLNMSPIAFRRSVLERRELLSNELGT